MPRRFFGRRNGGYLESIKFTRIKYSGKAIISAAEWGVIGAIHARNAGLHDPQPDESDLARLANDVRTALEKYAELAGKGE